MVTVGRKGSVTDRRHALSVLRQRNAVSKLFDEIVPQCEGRNGGYTRIMKLGRRRSDSSEMAILEWVGKVTDGGVEGDAVVAEAEEAK